MGVGKVVTAPVRGLWDLLTVDDEERAKHAAKRAEKERLKAEEEARNPERYGPTSGPSDRDFMGESKRRMKIIEEAQRLGIDPGVLIDAAELEESMRNRKMYTMDVMNQIASQRERERQNEMENLLNYLGTSRRGQGGGGGGTQPVQMAQSQMARRF